jgi:hypothetical protein
MNSNNVYTNKADQINLMPNLENISKINKKHDRTNKVA